VRRLIGLIVLALGLGRGQSGHAPAHESNPCAIETAEIDMLNKRVGELVRQIDQLNTRAVILHMQIAQKDEQLGFYMACAYAGIVPNGECEVDVNTLTVGRKIVPKKEGGK
jgi:hypothetical protein